MSKPVFWLILIIIAGVVLASMLPSRLYVESDRLFMTATVVTVLATLIALSLFFGAT